ncbi:MAG TPA: nuclear transport factor 2 family protein [Clostridia bacterium]|nr:nuclear transport factor 2 family protein [Clostridia bacterium]
MDNKEKVIALWRDMDKQNWAKISTYFEDDAIILWNNSNERFNVQEFVRVNSEYPGNWSIRVERLEYVDNLVISVVKVRLQEQDASFHATSFFEFNNGKIKQLNEYWGDDGKPPQWRIDMKIGKPIK